MKMAVFLNPFILAKIILSKISDGIADSAEID